MLFALCSCGKTDVAPDLEANHNPDISNRMILQKKCVALIVICRTIYQNG